MDYFSKLKNRIVPPKEQPTSAMQLSKFHKCWDSIHVTSLNAKGYKHQLTHACFIEYIYCGGS